MLKKTLAAGLVKHLALLYVGRYLNSIRLYNYKQISVRLCY